VEAHGAHGHMEHMGAHGFIKPSLSGGF